MKRNPTSTRTVQAQYAPESSCVAGLGDHQGCFAATGLDRSPIAWYATFACMALSEVANQGD